VHNTIAGTLASNRNEGRYDDVQESRTHVFWLPTISFDVESLSERDPASADQTEQDLEIGTQDTVTSEEANVTTLSIQSEKIGCPQRKETSPWFQFPQFWRKKRETDPEDDAEGLSLHTLRCVPFSSENSGSFWDWKEGGFVDEQSMKVARFLGWDDDIVSVDDSDDGLEDDEGGEDDNENCEESHC
jgi:hypothetical protein